MDPFAAIGLVGNIVSFLNFGFKLISTAKDIYVSTSGASVDNDDLSSRMQQLQQVSAGLKVSKPIGFLSDQERSVLEVAAQCMDISGNLEKLLEKLKAQKPGSKRATIKAAVRNWRKKDEKYALEERLDRCRQQLNLELLSLTRTESSERLNQIIAHGQASNDDMQSLIRNVESLRLCNTTSYIGDEALRQIQSLLNLTDDAVLKVRQARVLGGLRFELMNERFEDIEIAHRKTFDWIFDDRASSVVGNVASDDSNVNIDEIQSKTNEDDDEKPVDCNNTGDHGNFNKDMEDDQSWMATSNTNFNRYKDFKFAIDDEEMPTLIKPKSVTNSDDDEFVSPQASTQLDVEGVSGSSSKASAKVRSEFIAWLEQGSGIFHISGKPGAGKSTFMKYLTQHSRTKEHLGVWADGKKLLSSKFFFWKPGSDLQKNIKGLIRGLLYRLLSECPEFIPLVFPEQWEFSMQREVIHIEHDECPPAFERLVAASHDSSDHKLVIFIDGLDEFEGNHADLVRQLFRWTSKTNNLKLCISSREWVIFQDAFQDCPKLRLHELTRPDIRQFVIDRFREIGIETLLTDDNKYSVNILKETIIKESDGVFLWVSLILRHVEEGLRNGDRMKDLMRLIKSLPTELEPMLQQLLGSIPSNNRKLAYGMLSLARFNDLHDRELSLMQCSFLEEYVEDKDFTMKSNFEIFTARETKLRLDRAKKRVYGICKGFLEVRNAKVMHYEPKSPKVLRKVVHFTHRSIVEFLEGSYLKDKMDLEHPSFDPFDAFLQTYLGLLKHIHLPDRFFDPGIKVPPRQFDYRVDINDIENIMLKSFNSFHLSLIDDIELMVLLYFGFSKRRNALRFCQYLDSTYHALAGLNPYIESPLQLRVCGSQETHYNLADIIMLVCAQHHFHEFFEYLLSRQDDTSPELAVCRTSVCIIGFYGIWSENRARWPRAYKTFQVLSDNGTSGLLSASESSFHSLVGCWCGILPGPQKSRPYIGAIALLLYQGLNPRFSMVISTRKYQRSFYDKKIIGFETYFISEHPKSDSGHQIDTARLPVMNGKLQFLEATTSTTDILSKHGHVISLRALVTIWFPEYASILHQVIDWIVDLGVDIDTHHRRQFQSMFGCLLRPLFDQDHPEFVGWVDTEGDTWWPSDSMHWVDRQLINRGR